MSTLQTTTSTGKSSLSPATGDAYFETDTKNIIVWDGSAWRGYANDGAAFSKGSTCADFDGVDDYISVADADNLSFGNGSVDSPFTLALWLNSDTINNVRLIAKGQGTSAQEYSFTAGSSGTPNLNLWDLNTSTRIQIESQTALTQGTWQHWAVTYDGSGSHTNSKIYLNGNAVSTTTNTSGTYVAMHNTSTPLDIGRTNIGGPAYTDGKMDDVAIFSKQLTASEVKAIHDSNIYPEDDIVSFWRFEGNANDSIGSNDGTGNGGVVLNSTDIRS
jgi:hypothetical protein